MTTQRGNTHSAIAVGAILAASIYMATALAEPLMARENEFVVKPPHKIETVSQEGPGCSEEYPTLAAGILVMLNCRYGKISEGQGCVRGKMVARQTPCLWLPRSGAVSSAFWESGLTGRSGTLHSYTLGNEVGVPWWLVDQGRSFEGGRRDTGGWHTSRGVEVTTESGHRIYVP